MYGKKFLLKIKPDVVAGLIGILEQVSLITFDFPFLFLGTTASAALSDTVLIRIGFDVNRQFTFLDGEIQSNIVMSFCHDSSC
jgi:hypothetical protein